MCYIMYAISHYGERFQLGYIQMDFLECSSVDNMIERPKNVFWKNVVVITADVPYGVYKTYIGEKKKTLEDGSLFKVTLSEGMKGAFECQRYDEDNSQENLVLSIVRSEKCDSEKRNRIINSLKEKYAITTYESTYSEAISFGINLKTNQKYFFKVHDVGQALATSIQVEGKSPFIYFDYGWEQRKNRICKLELEVSEEDTIIFLSHADKDHWCGSCYNKDSLKCLWIVPKQNGRADYQKFLNNVQSSGGSVFWHDDDIDLGSIYFGNDKISKIKKNRDPKPTHQDGYAMYINAFEILNGIKRKIKITVSGDQDYDFQEPDKYQDSNILVACHHGGSYCWSKRFGGIFPATTDPVLVYSYGIPNKYYHPSERKIYEDWGWKVVHETPKHGTFTRDIYFH